MAVSETITVTLHADAPHAMGEPVDVPRRIGHLRIGEAIGVGGSGAVYHGFDEALQRRVAVKVLLQRVPPGVDPSACDLIAGVRTAAGLRHPNIVGVYQIELHERVPIIVMEHVDGPSLAQMLAQRSRCAPALARRLMRGIAAGVAALHEQQLIHRDVKPANVLFDRSGEPHVCDFGLACATHRPGAALDSGQRIAGTPLYMAPETFEGVVSAQSDVYGLGIMLFEMLAGGPPFRGDSITALQTAHQQRELPYEQLSNLRLDPAWQETLERATNKQRILRYKTATHFLRALEALPAPGASELSLQDEVARWVLETMRPGGAAAGARQAGPTAQNTFDLLRARAAKKRDGRSEPPSDE
ncbi:MAG: serine/threonine-protein kinase [Phycisphaerae bacterium]|nr:serine/threonine-protein kinase [Phycisphaerae bacterium]